MTEQEWDDWFEAHRLHDAAENGDFATVEKLLRCGHPVNSFDFFLPLTPLHYAVRAEHFVVTDLLLRSGADVNAHDERRIGDTPLIDVTPTCSLRMVRLLVEAGADPTIQGWMQLDALYHAKRRWQKEGDGGVGHAIYNLLREVAP